MSFLRYLLILSLFIGCKNIDHNDKSWKATNLTRYIDQMLIVGIGDARTYKELEKKSIGVSFFNFGFSSFFSKDDFQDDLKYTGGVILFSHKRDRFTRSAIYSHNQTKKLIKNLQRNAHVPLFIAVDQEGGIISRLRSEDFFHKDVDLESHQDLVKLDTKEVKEKSFKMAKQLKDIGFNINFAPVVDLNINKESPAIGRLKRSFSDDPKVVFNYAKAFIEGHNQAGIICSIKHFPGHGSAKADSHLGITDITNTWQEKELQPYIDLVKNDSTFDSKNMIMTAHVFNKNLDSKYPATMSYKINKEILRDKINFQGILISDDLQMEAVNDNFDFETIIIESINSGVNMFIVGNNINFDPKIIGKFRNAVLKNIENGKISKDLIIDSYNKIIKLKKSYGIISNY